MTHDEILSQMTEIFRDVLDEPSIELERATTAADIEEWDSLSHTQLVAAIEKHFKVRFTAREIQGFKNVGEMSDALERMLKR
ncbi:MAG TPA: acyl carrier protein [Polyangiales bacterium]|jgi:acyl carrier protein|nr:acyl carrier protein [Polyangiales bacterium]